MSKGQVIPISSHRTPSTFSAASTDLLTRMRKPTTYPKLSLPVGWWRYCSLRGRGLSTDCQYPTCKAKAPQWMNTAQRRRWQSVHTLLEHTDIAMAVQDESSHRLGGRPLVRRAGPRARRHDKLKWPDAGQPPGRTKP